MIKVKITVLKTMANKDLVDKYTKKSFFTLSNSRKSGVDLPCPRFKVGDEFITDGLSMPKGFPCDWAWADIQRDVCVLAFGGNFYWMDKGVGITCCTDGLRPVVFKLKRIEE